MVANSEGGTTCYSHPPIVCYDRSPRNIQGNFSSYVNFCVVMAQQIDSEVRRNSVYINPLFDPPMSRIYG